MNDSHDYSQHLPSNLRLELWKRIDRHLQKGDILITDEQFLRVMEKDFLRLVKVKASPAIRQALYEMIVHVNEQYS
jgi:DNA primase large subunit